MEDLSHCLDNLRQIIQCQGDISVLTYSYRPDYMYALPALKSTYPSRHNLHSNQVDKP